jgi:hypothetical protein
MREYLLRGKPSFRVFLFGIKSRFACHLLEAGGQDAR